MLAVKDCITMTWDKVGEIEVWLYLSIVKKGKETVIYNCKGEKRGKVPTEVGDCLEEDILLYNFFLQTFL